MTMKILIVKTSALGDIIHAFDALSYLRERYPFAQIDWVVEKAGKQLVTSHPAVSNVYTINTKVWRYRPFSSYKEWKALFSSMPRYQLVFDLQGNCKSGWVLWNVKGELKIGFGSQAVAEKPNCYMTHRHVNPPPGQNIRDDYLAVVQSFFKDKAPYKAPPVVLSIPKEERNLIEQIPKDAVLLCPFAAWANKRLPQALLLEAAKKEKGPYYIIWGDEVERRIADKIAALLDDAYVLPKFSLPVLQQLMARCRKILTMDSLPLHLAGTTNTPTVSFFGPSSSQKYAPKGEHQTVFQGSCPFNQTFEKRCPRLRSCQSADCINKLKLR